VIKANREVTTWKIDGGARDLRFQACGGAGTCGLGRKDREGGSGGLYKRLGRPRSGPKARRCVDAGSVGFELKLGRTRAWRWGMTGRPHLSVTTKAENEDGSRWGG
jgi:hypothetical protein